MGHLAARRGQQAERHPHPRIARPAQEQRVRRPGEGSDHAQRHQRVHRRRRVPQPPYRPGVERQRTPDGDRRGQHEAQPLPVAELKGGCHRQRQDRNGQQGGDQQPPHLLAARGTLGPRRRRPVLRGPGRRRHLGAVARPLDRRDEIVRRHVRRMHHAGPPGGEVDRGAHALDPGQPLLDTVHAGRAGHPADDQIGGGHHLRPPGRHRVPPVPPLCPCGRPRSPTNPGLSTWVDRMPGATGPAPAPTA